MKNVKNCFMNLKGHWEIMELIHELEDYEEHKK